MSGMAPCGDHAGLHLSEPVRRALEADRPVVALESTVYSTLGLPVPHNRAVLEACVEAIDSKGAVPALTTVLDGVARVGLDDPGPILEATRKVSARDLAVAVAQRWPSGVTTVGASLTLSARAGIGVFATGGIGGVHRDVDRTGDVSGDLAVIAQHPIVTVCAGAKSFLDLPRTFEMLETLGVTVVGYGVDELPAFTALHSGIEAPHRSDDAAEIAAILRERRALGQGGVLVCAPPPTPIDPAVLDDATDEAEARADRAGVTGAGRTPYVLAAIAELTGGASVEANTALVANNAAVAADIATALAD